jgi:hypothetical protein
MSTSDSRAFAFVPTPFEDPRVAYKQSRPMSASKRRSQNKHQQRRNTTFKAEHGKAFAEMTLEERTAVKTRLRGTR